MKTSTTVAQVFAPTTINPGSVHAYLFGLPQYYHAGYATNASEYALTLLNCTDFFEFQFRRYLSGRYPTLRRVFREIRQFQEVDEAHAARMIAFSLAAVKETILLNEWYELMPRYEKAKQRIQTQFDIKDLAEYTD